MSAVINTNIAAIRTHNTYNRNNDYMNSAMTKVATGMKINSAKDGGSVWAISEKMRERIRANDQAHQNVQNDIAMLKTAEGGVGNTIEILKTLKERAVNAANDSNINQDRGVLQTEVNQLLKQIDENATQVKFNGRTLLDGKGVDSTKAVASGGDDDELDLSERTVMAVLGAFSDGTNSDGDSTFEGLKVGSTDIDGGISNTATLAISVNGNNVWTASDNKTRGTTLQEAIDAINIADLGVKAQLLTAAGTLTDPDGNTILDENGDDYQAAAGLYFVGKDGEAVTVSITSSDSKITFSPAAVSDMYIENPPESDYNEYEVADQAQVTDTTIAALLDAKETSPTDGTTIDLSTIEGLYKDDQGTAFSSGDVVLTYYDGTGTTHNGDPAGWYNETGYAVKIYTEKETSGSGSLNFHIGGEANFTTEFNLEDMSTKGLKINGLDITSVDKAKSAMTTIDNALQTALKYQTTIGSFETRLGYTSDNLVTMNENLEAADSTMRDADIAKEMTSYMKYTVLAQASQYMLAQASQNAFSVLNLLQA